MNFNSGKIEPNEFHSFHFPGYKRRGFPIRFQWDPSGWCGRLSQRVA